MKTTHFGPFLGINNRLSPTALRVTTSQLNGQYLADAVNVDIDNTGKLCRRAATTLVHADTGAHSLFEGASGVFYMVRASNLYHVVMSPYAETLVTALSNDLPMSYAVLAGMVYASNGTDRLRIDGTTSAPYGLPTPAQPACATQPAGGLPQGIYKVALSFFNNATGEESGLSPATHFSAAASTDIVVTLPSPPAGSTHTRLYVSTQNGTVPLHHTTVPNGTPSITVSTPGTGWEAYERFEDVLPPGRLFVSNGKLCSVANTTVYVGIPFRPGYHVPSESYLQFPAPVTIAIENQGGTYIVADKTYFFPGDLVFSETVVDDVFPFGAVPGTEFRDTEGAVVGWFSHKGIVVAGKNGEASAVTMENIDVVPPVSGNSVILEGRGYKHVVSCGWSVNLENNRATRYTGWDFSSVSGGYGTSTGGIYALESDGLVDALIDFGKFDFGTENLKLIPNVYLGTDCAEAFLMEMVMPDDTRYTYKARSYQSGVMNQRFDLGKGLRCTWFGAMLMNQNGADFTISTLSLAPTVSTRRI